MQFEVAEASLFHCKGMHLQDHYKVYQMALHKYHPDNIPDNNFPLHTLASAEDGNQHSKTGDGHKIIPGVQNNRRVFVKHCQYKHNLRANFHNCYPVSTILIV